MRPSFAFSYTDSVTAQHSNSGRQRNCATLSRGRHLYLARRPSRWASAHILVLHFNSSSDDDENDFSDIVLFSRATSFLPAKYNVTVFARRLVETAWNAAENSQRLAGVPCTCAAILRH